MVTRVGSILWVVTVILFVSSSLCLAQSDTGTAASTNASGENGETKGKDKNAKTEEEVVKKGVIASYGRHRQSATVDAAATPAAGDEQSAISGSVSRQKEKCVVKVINNGKNSYSVSFAVKGTSPRGTQTFRQVYSAALKPDQTVTRETRCHKDDNVEIEILSGHKTSK